MLTLCSAFIFPQVVSTHMTVIIHSRLRSCDRHFVYQETQTLPTLGTLPTTVGTLPPTLGTLPPTLGTLPPTAGTSWGYDQDMYRKRSSDTTTKQTGRREEDSEENVTTPRQLLWTPPQQLRHNHPTGGNRPKMNMIVKDVIVHEL